MSLSLSAARLKCIGSLIFFFVIFFTGQALAQQRTVGDGTAFIFNPGKSESYGISGGDVGGFSSADFQSGFASRHHRMEGSTGIGSSTLQTTSATSESTPRTARSFEQGRSQFSLSQNQTSANAIFANPGYSALQSSAGTGFNGGAFANIGFKSLYSTDSGNIYQLNPDRTLQNIDAIPSFNRRSSGLTPVTDFDSSFFKRVSPQF